MSKIEVKYQPTEFVLSMDGEWECQHPTTWSDTFEHCDYYLEAVTGLPQPIAYEPIENCDTCPAYYSTWDEEWFDGGTV